VEITGDAKCPDVLGGTVTLDEGDDIACTITNDDIAPKLTVIKTAINDDGLLKTAADFTMNVTGTNVAPSATFPGSTTGTTVTLNQGSYSVTETPDPDYTTTYSADCTGTINVGEEKTCTVTNDDKPFNVKIDKDDKGMELVAGGPSGTYTLTVTNTDERDAAEPVEVTDYLPPELVLAGPATAVAPSTATCVESGGNPVCTIPASELGVGESVQILVPVKVPANVTATSTTNLSVVDTPEDPVCPEGVCPPPSCPEPDGVALRSIPSDNIDCEDTPITQSADLKITKTATPTTVGPGSVVTYTLKVENLGPSDAQNAVVNDTVPDAFVSATLVDDGPYTCTLAFPALSCTISTHPVGVTATITFTAVVSGAVSNGQVIVNTGTVTSSTPDPDLSNNSSSATVEAAVAADLVVTKSADPTIVLVNSNDVTYTVTWTVVVTNNGPNEARNVSMTDLVPAPAKIVGTPTATGGFTCTAAAVCTAPSLAAGASGTITITTTFTGAQVENGQQLINKATVTSSTPDSNGTNNSAEATSTIVKELPPTGADPRRLLLVGTLTSLLGVGLWMTTLRRRRFATVTR
jgi:uncharacterized repeat protein (TIGR01451 family)